MSRVDTQDTPLLVSVDQWLRRHPALVQIIRTFRNIVHFGPWRSVGLAYLRMRFHHRDPIVGTSDIMVAPVNTAAAVTQLEKDGYFAGLRLKPDIARRALEDWQTSSAGVYIDAHLQNDAIASVVGDPEILRIVNGYFGCEAHLVECKVFITDNTRPDILTSGFHFDHAGLRSLNVMVYLTDVGQDTGPHVLVPGTHRGKRFADFCREYTPIEEIERRYPGRIMTIMAPAGTVLIENAEVFHRRDVAHERRAAMIAVFSTRRRRPLSGRYRRGAAR